MKHFISLSHFTQEQVRKLIGMAMEMKKGSFNPTLDGKNLILLFFNPSLRTRTSFELAMQQLNGNVVTLNAGEDTWKLETEEGVVMDGGAAEHIKDAARVLGRYAEAIGIRAFARGENWEKDRQDPVINAFVEHSGASIINMESSLYHPNQALADVMTIMERHGPQVRGLPVTITWANHPNPLPMAVPNSILLACALFGMELRFLRPRGYDLDPQIMERVKKLSTEAGGSFTVTDQVEEGYRGSRVVYAKSWGSIQFYGDKQKERAYRKELTGWIVNEEKMAATDDAMFLHCLPVRRNVVVTDRVLDAPRVGAFDEAENRLHAQKAVLYHLLGESS
jgi:N-acetylornithine carbamoyltransferase